MGLRFDVEVSLALGADLTADPSTWSWTDITAYAMLTDGGVEIHRGRSDWQSQVQPSWCTVRLNNADGRFSRLNPAGAYYGQLAKNTPLRIRACAAGGSLVTRFVGYVSEWPPRWTPGQLHQWVPVRADGVLRRLGQGTLPIRSALRRTTPTLSTVAAYFPVEGYTRPPTSVATPLTGVPAATVGGTKSSLAVWDGERTLPGSLALPFLDARSGGLNVTADKVISPGPALGVGYWVRVFANDTDTAEVCAAAVDGDLIFDDGSNITVQFARESSSGTITDQLEVDRFSGGTTVASTYNPPDLVDEWRFVYVRFAQSGADVAVTVFLDNEQVDTGTFSTVTLTDVVQVRCAAALVAIGTPQTSSSGSFSFGHYFVLSGSTTDMDDDAALIYSAGLGHPGEAAADRIDRLCDEEAVTISVTAGDSALMGVQPAGTLLSLLRECEAADHGVLYEALTGELAYKPLSAYYNLTAALELDHDEGHLVGIDVADDDRLTRNDVTVTRVDGASAQATDATSIAAVGLYDTAPILNLYTDDQPEQHASWLLHVGTVDEYRYPRIELALHKSSSLVTAWLACDISSRLTVDNMPTNPSPDLVDQIIEGYTERVNSVAYDVNINLSPYAPFNVGEYGAASLGLSGQIVTDGASTLTNLDFTGLNVDLTGGKMLRLTITVDDPFELGNSIFYLGVGGLTNWIQWRFGVQTGTTVASFKPGEQTVITLLLSEIQAVNGTITLSAAGVPSVLSGFTDARFQVDDDGNAIPVTVDLHSVEVVQPSRPGAYCSITFDDGHDSVTDLAYPKMAALGFKGTEYIIVEAVDTADHVTSADLAARHAAGWEIGGHSFASSVHTASLINVDEAAAAADMASNVAWLQANFPDPDGRYTMAYPKGEFFDTTDAVAIEPLVQAAGYLAGRSSMCNPGSTTSLQIESLPPPIYTRLYGAGGISDVSAGQQNPTNMIAAGGMLDKLESNGGWLILAFHVITAGAASTSIQCSQADFDAIMDDLAARDITVAPVRDVLALLDAEQPSRYGTEGCTLHTAVDSDDTTVVVRPGDRRWTQAAADFDPDLRLAMGGEVFDVSAIAAGTSFVAVGTVDHDVNGQVIPQIPAGTVAGDQMFLLAACREATSTVADVTGWTRATDDPGTNVALFRRQSDGADSAPTVQFSGSVAGADTSAQIVTFRRLAVTGATVTDEQSNSSAQNIAYPGATVPFDCALVILCGWKQDDWTSVAPPSGFTEIDEPDSTAGDDHGIYWAYQIQTDRTQIPAGSIVVTGGAAAVSKAFLAVYPGTQSMTVAARSVNGVVKSHSIGATVELAQHAIYAL